MNVDAGGTLSESQTGETCPNPDFDDGRVIWDDAYSGIYAPASYDEQFDDQWRLFMERRLGFRDHTGVETSDQYIDDRIFELTGVQGVLARQKFGGFYPFVRLFRDVLGKEDHRDVGGRLYLEPKFPFDFFREKSCFDFGCGAGRWTRTLLALGAQVKSVDVSEFALKSTRRFNADVEKLDLFTIPDREDLHEAFDFTLSWGVVMCTHDPKLAFENVAHTVKSGGMLYLMVYAPTYHASDTVRRWRKHYHRSLLTFEERLQFAYEIAEDPKNAINYLDMLNTFFNWTIPEETVHDWFAQNGFADVVTLNKTEPHNCAWHVLGRKK
jgi:SAM-dependent methyltransferase